MGKRPLSRFHGQRRDGQTGAQLFAFPHQAEPDGTRLAQAMGDDGKGQQSGESEQGGDEAADHGGASFNPSFVLCSHALFPTCSGLSSAFRAAVEAISCRSEDSGLDLCPLRG
jgi:hypothetical protein